MGDLAAKNALLYSTLILNMYIYHHTSDISFTKSQHFNFSSRLSIVFAQSIEASCEWKRNGSSADRRCFNYFWVINNFIAYWGTPYIRGLRVYRCSCQLWEAKSLYSNYHKVSWIWKNEAHGWITKPLGMWKWNKSTWVVIYKYNRLAGPRKKDKMFC